MKKINERIEQALACEVIKLSEQEKNIYSGSGWKLAYFVDGELKELFDFLKTPHKDDSEEMANSALESAIAWIKLRPYGEIWLAMCSCCELCAPEKIELEDASSIARLARIIGQEVDV